MAPWINYHVHRWLTKEFVPQDAPWYSFPNPSKTRLGTNADGLGLIVANPDDLNEWVKGNSKAIVSFPYRKQKRVIFLHSLWTDDDSLYGLKGFHVAAPVALLAKGAATRGVLSKSKDSDLMDTIVPSLKDMMGQAGIKDVMGMNLEDLGEKGSGRRLSKEFIKEPSMLSWSPLFLREVFRVEFDHEWPGEEEDSEVIPPVESEVLLWHVIRQASEAVKDGTTSADEAGVLWQRHAQTLWVLSKGAKEKPSIRDPEEAEELALASQAFSQLMKNLDRFKNIARQSKAGKEVVDKERHAPAADQGAPGDEGGGEMRRVEPRASSAQQREESGPRQSAGRATVPTAGREAPLAARDDAEDAQARRSEGTRAREPESPVRRRGRPDEDRLDQPPPKRARPSRREAASDASPGSSGGSSSSEDDESSFSTDEEGKRRRRRKRGRKSRKGRHETVSDDDEPHRLSTRRLTLEVLRSFADHQEWQSKRERTKNSALKNWADSQLRLVRLLSSKGFAEASLPSTSKFLRNLCRHGKQLNRAFNIIKESSERGDWACRLSENAITYFLARGLGNDEVKDTPQGVSTFAFISRDKLEQRTKKERKRQLQETFGDGKLSDEVLNELADNHLHIPTDLEEAHDQLDSMMAFLVEITGVKEEDGNVAIRGFRYAKRFLKKHRWDVRRAMRDDKSFLTKFMYMVDRWWQHYLSSLLEKGDDEADPLARPHAQLWNHHVWFMDQELDTLSQGGAVPALSLPVRLRSLQRELKGPRGEAAPNEKRGGGQADRNQKGDEGADKITWHYKNPTPRKEWGVPSGKRFNDFFGREVKENREGFPQFAHHVSGKPSPICVYYQAAGRIPDDPGLGDDEEEDVSANTSLEPESSGTPESQRGPRANKPGRKQVGGEGGGSQEPPQVHPPSQRAEYASSTPDKGFRQKRPDAVGRWESPTGGVEAPAIVEQEEISWDRMPRQGYQAEEWSNHWGLVADDMSSSEGEIERKAWKDSDARADAASRRNWNRIIEANARDKRIIGKNLPTNTGAFFPFGMRGPDDFEKPNKSWMERIKDISWQQEPTPSGPREIVFATTGEALKRNATALKEADWDLGSLLAKEEGTTVGPGSEFRNWDHVRCVLNKHPNLRFLEGVFKEGMKYHYETELPEPERVREVRAQLARGNHKSAAEDLDHLSGLLNKDVFHGFCLPVPREVVPQIKGALVQPAGIVEQFSLQADGSRKKKRRLTHDLSFSAEVKGAAVNERVNIDMYPEMVYGWCLNRIIHFVACLRADYPGKRIFAQKFDYADAYRRVAHHHKAAAETILVVGEIAYIMLRLAFGGSPNPPCFCSFSEALTDLANELACSDADPREFHVPTVAPGHLEPMPYPRQDEPIAPAIRPAFEVPTSLTSRKDCFIDDIINIFLDTERNRERECYWVPLAVHLLSRPHAGDEKEPVPRRPLLGPDKLEAEGRPSEIQIILGWRFDFRTMKVSLPDDKFAAWSGDLREVIRLEKTRFGDWESTVGRLNHVAFVIPLSRHFLNRIRLRLKHRVHRGQVLRLRSDEVADLKLWLDFLTTANEGLPMDLLTVRTPTRLAWSDSCPYGMGGYTQAGRAWRLKIPEQAAFHGDDTVNNVLEFLAMAVNVLLLIQEAESERFACIMPLGDNTSAIGWMFRSGRMGPKSSYYEAVQFIAQRVAREVMTAQVQLSPQHIAGEKNDVADLLSFQGEERGKTNPLTLDSPDNALLTSRIRRCYPQEASHEDIDRTWRRWTCFLDSLGSIDHVLDGVPPSGQGLLVKSFLIAVREAQFDQQGRIIGKRKKPMVASTLRDAAGFLGQAFRRRERPSPVHIPDAAFGRPSLIGPIRDLLKALEKSDPPPTRQAAATPELLNCMNQLAECFGEEAQHTADLTSGAFFFAMRACEFCETPTRGRTKLLTLGNVTFRDKAKKVIPHDHPMLQDEAHYVTICFVDQKNADRMDRRTQGPSGKPGLCPIRAWARVVKRVRAHNPKASSDTPVCELRTKWGDRSRISAKQVADGLKRACRFFGGDKRFGFGPDDLGTRSIRSGGAMSLFIMDHSVEKIKILGRWSSDAFLVYIRPQVLEWTSIMAEDMASTKNFLDLTYARSDRNDSESDQWRNLGTMFPSFRLGR